MSTQEDDREQYPVPRFVTSQGLEAYYEEVGSIAREVDAELERLAAEDRKAGRRSEQHAGVVRQAVDNVLSRRGQPAVSGRFETLSFILLTIATVGLTITGIVFVHSVLQVVLCLALAGVAVVGLVLKWQARPGRGPRPR
jgi:hypothetical protein